MLPRISPHHNTIPLNCPGFVLLMTIFVILCVPETKGVPIEELNEVIVQKVGGQTRTQLQTDGYTHSYVVQLQLCTTCSCTRTHECPLLAWRPRCCARCCMPPACTA